MRRCKPLVGVAPIFPRFAVNVPSRAPGAPIPPPPPPLKVILHNEKQDGFPLTSLREIQLLKRISHPSCVRLLDVAVGRRREMVFLVFEYCEHDLAGLLDSTKKPFSESDVRE